MPDACSRAGSPALRDASRGCKPIAKPFSVRASFVNTGVREPTLLWQHQEMRDWPGRAHVETLRVWPELAQTVARIEARRDLFSGAFLIGSLSRGEGDALSDVDLVAVTQPGRWQEAWDARDLLSSGALVTFDRSEGTPGIAGHSWLTPNLVKVECLITETAGTRLAGSVAVVVGEDYLLNAFERVAPFSRQEIDDYAADLRERNAISDIERTYGDLIRLLRSEVRPDSRSGEVTFLAGRGRTALHHR
jgi:hypothetical protein